MKLRVLVISIKLSFKTQVSVFLHHVDLALYCPPPPLQAAEDNSPDLTSGHRVRTFGKLKISS